MAVLLGAVAQPGAVRGRAPTRFSRAAALPVPGRLPQDYRYRLPSLGEIRDRVMLKTSPTAPEVPMPLARVRLFRYIDGFLAWQGFSDNQGYYHAKHLELGVVYEAMASDMSGEHKTVGAGRVVAKQGV